MKNIIVRDRLHTNAVECPICGRQVPRPTDHLIAFGATDPVTADTADAFECPVCSGVTFISDDQDAST
jgi:predicted RNA-binding Zn-ribbon protein involved in translation (DUF1610 family)